MTDLEKAMLTQRSRLYLEGEGPFPGHWYKLVDLAKKHGLTIDWEAKQPHTPAQYKGDFKIAGCESTSNIIHDIAHHVVASPSRRKLLNWGLGSGPSDYNGDDTIPMKVSERFADMEEQRASLLGIFFERELGFPWWLTWEAHNWTVASNREWRALRWLHGKDLLKSLNDFWEYCAHLSFRYLHDSEYQKRLEILQEEYEMLKETDW